MIEMTLSELCAALAGIATPTLSSQLIKRGFKRTHIAGAARLVGTERICGPAFTIRFIPEREDLAVPQSYGWPNSLPQAIDSAPEGHVVVVDAGGHPSAGTVGDIFATSLKARGIKGIVSDGPVRDLPGLRQVGLPVWANGTTPPPSIGGLSFVSCGEPIGCGQAAVLPGDLIVADEDGVVVVPAAIAHTLIEDCREQDALEAWVLEQAATGRPLVGLYPPDEATLAAFQASRGKA